MLTNLNPLTRHRSIFGNIQISLSTVSKVGLSIRTSSVPGFQDKSSNPNVITMYDHEYRKIGKTYLFLQIRLLIHLPHPLLRILHAPLRRQPPRQHSINPNLRTLRTRQTPHKMQLRRLGHAIRHTTATRDSPCDAGRHDEDAALRVGVECWCCGAHEVDLLLYVDGVAAVPVVGSGRGEIGESGEAGEALGRGLVIEGQRG